MSAQNKSAFVKQSSWMVIATFTGGGFMALVHTVASKMGSQEYSTFVTLLRLLIIMGIPSAALQIIFARQAAAATNEHDEQQLQAATRAILLSTFVFWFIATACVLVAFRPLSQLLKITHPSALYFTVVLILTSLWIPVLKGLLQGKYRFGWLGWLQVTDGVGRFSMMVLLILFLHGKAASGMFAALAGQIVTLALGLCLTVPFWWKRPALSFQWRIWWSTALPLTLGMGAVLLMSSIDMVFVQGLFADTAKTALYGAAMLTGFAIIQFIAPVTLVMFSRVAQSVARSENTNSLGMTLAATISFGLVAAIGCSLFPKLPLCLMYASNRTMWQAAPLVPWFAWALLPLTVANVLVQNILARARFEAVPWLILAPAIYAALLCLQAPHLLELQPFDAFIRVIQTLGACSLLLCAIAAWFSLGGSRAKPSGLDLAEGRSIVDTASSRAE